MEKAISLRTVTRTLSNSRAPSCCPTMMDTAVPMEIHRILKRLAMVEEMFIAATAIRPRVE